MKRKNEIEENCGAPENCGVKFQGAFKCHCVDSVLIAHLYSVVGWRLLAFCCWGAFARCLVRTSTGKTLVRVKLITSPLQPLSVLGSFLV